MPKSLELATNAHAFAHLRLAARGLLRGADIIDTPMGIKLASAHPQLSVRLAMNSANSALERTSAAITSSLLTGGADDASRALVTPLQQLRTALQNATMQARPLEEARSLGPQMRSLSEALAGAAQLGRT